MLMFFFCFHRKRTTVHVSCMYRPCGAAARFWDAGGALAVYNASKEGSVRSRDFAELGVGFRLLASFGEHGEHSACIFPVGKAQRK